MIYRLLIKNMSLKKYTNETHLLGEELLAYGLFIEEGIIYRNEPLVLNKWGKPSLRNYPRIKYSISHSENFIACVISEKFHVGIDVERVRNFNSYAARRVCSEGELEIINSKSNPEREFFRYWTLKESYVKALGMGLSYPMKKVNFEVNPNGEIRSDLSDCKFQLIEDTKEFIIAVCYRKISDGE